MFPYFYIHSSLLSPCAFSFFLFQTGWKGGNFSCPDSSLLFQSKVSVSRINYRAQSSKLISSSRSVSVSHFVPQVFHTSAHSNENPRSNNYISNPRGDGVIYSRTAFYFAMNTTSFHMLLSSSGSLPPSLFFSLCLSNHNTELFFLSSDHPFPISICSSFSGPPQIMIPSAPHFPPLPDCVRLAALAFPLSEWQTSPVSPCHPSCFTLPIWRKDAGAAPGRLHR